MFSALAFDASDAGVGDLAAEDGGDVDQEAADQAVPRRGNAEVDELEKEPEEEVNGGWLEADDIDEDWD